MRTKSKVAGIRNCHRPDNLGQLKSFLGMVNYHGRYIPNLSSLLQPLTALLRKGQNGFGQLCEQLFHLVKNRLTSAPVLAYYDPGLPLRVATNALSYGVGGFILHVPRATESLSRSGFLIKWDERYTETGAVEFTDVAVLQ